MKKIVLTLLIFLCFGHVWAQKEGNVWYFGEKAGVDFNTGAPVGITDGAMATLEGCAAISDEFGKILFYTDGISVYNRLHKKMPNGTGLAGDPSSTQSGIIVPKPGSSTIYYIFTVDKEAGPGGLQYSVVDLNKDGGNGDVISANNLLKAPVSEKLTAVLDANLIDIWVIAHDWESNNYLTYHVTANGVDPTPIKSPGSIYMGGDKYSSIGYLKVAPGGNKLACVVDLLPGNGEICDFNNSNGKVSNPIRINKLDNPYGLEFSPDNSKLYISCYSSKQVLQYDLSLKDSAKIQASRTIVRSSINAIGALQLGPDGKIYLSLNGSPYLGVITYPNKVGTACNYVDNAVPLKGRSCDAGLPTFIQSYFKPLVDFGYDNSCLDIPVHFTGHSNVIPEEWYWDFGDPATGVKNTSKLQNPTHAFSSPGKYTVNLVVTIKGKMDTARHIVRIAATPKVELGNDRVACANQPVMLDAGNPGFKYRWSTGDTTRVIYTILSGKYWVEVSNGDCIQSDTVRLTFVGVETFSLGNDTIVCAGVVLKKGKRIPGATMLWSTGDTTPVIKITKTGMYWLKAQLGDCIVGDTILVFFKQALKVNIGKDTIICEGDSTVLDAGNKHAVFNWSTGENTQTITVTQGGTYWVQVKNAECVVTDTIKIRHCRAKVIFPNAFSPDLNRLNDSFRPYGTDIILGRLAIANRWGEIVYESEDFRKGWDGKGKNGEPCPLGLYIYAFRYWEEIDGILYSKNITGSFMLVR